jgi:hypothetical protein
MLASCAQTWNDAQKTQLTTRGIPAPEIADAAYKSPVGKQDSGPAAIVNASGSPAAGGVGNALGQLVVEGIGAVQQNMYDKAAANVHVAQSLPTDLSGRIRRAVTRELDTQGFFAGKVKEKSPNRLVIHVDS